MQRLCLLLSFAICLAACQQHTTGQNSSHTTENTVWTPPVAGTVVAADSMKTDDKLNDFYFAVKLAVSHNNSKPGNYYGFIYDLDAHYGPNDAMSELTMPKGGEHLKPVLRKAEDEEYGYIVGFIPPVNMGGDGVTFQPYYLVRAVKAGASISIEVKPLKRYSFD